MCGRYTITRQEGLIEDLEAVIDQPPHRPSAVLRAPAKPGLAIDPSVQRNVWWKPRFNVAPTQDAPVVTLRDGVRTLEMMRWGLVPFWAGRDGSRPPLMINARVETLRQKPMFRDALSRGRRCLVPADGFFEWKRGPNAKAPKQPMWMHPSDHRFFAFAGLWARNKGAMPEAGEIHSFTIVTGPPNDLVAPIHDRMPVVLSPAAWSAWLDPSVPTDAAVELLGVPPVADWVAEPVSPWVNVADHDDDRCIAPMTEAPAEPPKQGTLF
jgi:putative SOS response-associated peptidase YedK